MPHTTHSEPAAAHRTGHPRAQVVMTAGDGHAASIAAFVAADLEHAVDCCAQRRLMVERQLHPSVPDRVGG